ncbi:MAG: pectin acetylesterase-family hydrolase [Myxococcota bacterium]
MTPTGARSLLRFSGLLVLMVVPMAARAELGDYSTLQVVRNLLVPPGPDNPVSDGEQTGPFPLLANPPGFDDGFDPARYYEWQTIQLHPGTDSVCGNGSPYKFFVNRTPETRNTIIYLEGGGACWDGPSCRGETGIRGARNPDGIPDDYMSLLNPGASAVSPYVFRAHPYSRVKTQDWNMVYVPYCTGDIYVGDTVQVYADPAGVEPPLIWHHNGARNVLAVLAWLKDNLPRPTQMLTAGCSAGSIGALAGYELIRGHMAPTRGYLIDDSGPAFSAPQGGDPADHPSIPLHQQIREAWGLDGAHAPIQYLKTRLPKLNTTDLGSMYRALADKYPNDRMGQTHFWEDLNYSSYSYERFYDEIENAPSQETKELLIHERWYLDTENLMEALEALPNFGYYLPRYRALNESHCTTIVDFENGDIQEDGLELSDFIDDVLEGSGPVMQASEEDRVSDFQKPPNPLYIAIDELLQSGGI